MERELLIKILEEAEQREGSIEDRENLLRVQEKIKKIRAINKLQGLLNTEELFSEEIYDEDYDESEEESVDMVSCPAEGFTGEYNEKEDSISVYLDMPNVLKQDIEVVYNHDNKILSINGKRKDNKCVYFKNILITSIEYVKDVDLNLDLGVLTVKITGRKLKEPSINFN